MNIGEQAIACFDVYGVIAGQVEDIDEGRNYVTLRLEDGSRFSGKYLAIQEASLFK